MLDKNLMHKLAVLNPYGSVDKVFDEYAEPLIGVKNSSKMPMKFIKQKFGKAHTFDASAFGGRAVDILLKNPVTGMPMTGSSSGTAINVFVGINDIGVGLDGGGSVLAPAMSLNLFAYVSPLLASTELEPMTKVSTDGIEFRPSLGYMTRSFDELANIVDWKTDNKYDFTKADCVLSAPRKVLINYLQDVLPKYDFIISREGPIDTDGFGDTILGHFSNMSQRQKISNKGLIRVVNMAKATAISLPTKQFAVADVLICQSKPNKISKMITYAKSIAGKRDALIARYFENLEMYFDECKQEA